MKWSLSHYKIATRLNFYKETKKTLLLLFFFNLAVRNPSLLSKGKINSLKHLGKISIKNNKRMERIYICPYTH